MDWSDKTNQNLNSDLHWNSTDPPQDTEETNSEKTENRTEKEKQIDSLNNLVCIDDRREIIFDCPIPQDTEEYIKKKVASTLENPKLSSKTNEMLRNVFYCALSM